MKEKKHKYEKAVTENKPIMIDYIEEMMNTAGVEQKIVGCQSYIRTDNCDGLSCDSCDWYNTNKCYPDFTAEKQIEIIKLLNDTRDFHCVNNTLSALTEDGDEIEVNSKDFTQALANLINELMNAGELDKQKVKGILE